MRKWIYCHKDKEMKEIRVEYCPRCGEDHGIIMAQRFQGNFISSDGSDFNYWGWCPYHLDPIIFSVDEDEELAERRTGEEETEVCKDSTVCRCPSECKDSQSGPDEVEPVPTD